MEIPVNSENSTLITLYLVLEEMKVVGIVGSPHRDGLTSRLVRSALQGAREGGAYMEIAYLVDYDIKPWSDESMRAPEDLNRILRNSDAYVLGAPVYYLDVNGLTKDFMDTADFGDANGKPGLGISMAGGTGKGLILAVKSIYYFFFCKGIRGIKPLPVSRFNYDEALVEARKLGSELVEMARERRPFRDLRERVEYYSRLEYMEFDMVDELLLLVQQLLRSSPRSCEVKDKAKQCYETAVGLIKRGRKAEAIEHVVKAYELLYY